MQRIFTGLLCFSVLLVLCGCATFQGDSSRAGKEPAPQAETKAAAPIPGTVQTAPAASVATPPGTTPAAQGKAVPVVEIPEKSFDFGVMNEDRDYTHKFIIKNVGTSELVIKKILPG